MAGEIYPKLHEFLRTAGYSDNFKLVPLQGNGTNRHFALASQNATYENNYFLKVFVTNSLQVVNRQEQFQIQLQLAQQNLAPMPIALSDCQTFWLEQWCEPADPIASLGLQSIAHVSDSSINELANTLVKIHQCEVQAPMLDLEAEWHRYLAISSTKTDTRLQHFLTLLKENWGYSDLCFCHNDLHYSHVLQLTPVRVVDWEYAAIGNRYFDIAACGVVNQLNEEQLSRFMEQYSLKMGLPKSKVQQGVQLMIAMVDFTNELWHNAYNQIT